MTFLNYSKWAIFCYKEENDIISTPVYILYNNLVNKQYLNLKLNDYIRQSIVQLILALKLWNINRNGPVNVVFT